MKEALHNPLPETLAKELEKATDILSHFIKHRNKMDAALIPSSIIKSAKGVAVMSVIKGGFVWSGRAGSGIVVARLSNGQWSAPCAISTAGVGFGAQIGASLTDVVLVLNTEDAVKAFMRSGNVTLGGNMSVAAGPVGRQTEAAGAIMDLAPIYSYSKTKGLFAGLSLEGAVIMTRNDANSTFYQKKVTAREILTGEVEAPAIAAPLYSVLNSRFGPDAIIYGTNEDNVGLSKVPIPQQHFNQPAPPYTSVPPPIPQRLKKAVALYPFAGERPGDLSFSPGDVIEIIRSSGSTNDWWTGRCQGREGVFPANYVQIQ
jgi:lipid-binding SYLF domain-containing protein